MIEKFITKSEKEVFAITTEQMIEVDRIAMEETGPNIFQMMENAGRNLATLALKNLKKLDKKTVLVLAGTGGNGGGGICAARHLANKGIDVYLSITNIDRLTEVPGRQLEIFKNTTGKLIPEKKLDELQPTVILDAIIGYSLNAAPRGSALKFIQYANSINEYKISLDVPSGIDSTTGNSEGEYFHANATITLALPKTGLTPDKTGKLYLADIGIPVEVYNKIGNEYSFPFGNKYIVRLYSARNG